MLPHRRKLRVGYADVFMAERGEHELSLECTGQQIGQVLQTLHTLLGAQASGARQRVTATSSYSLVSPSYIECAHPGITESSVAR